MGRKPNTDDHPLRCFLLGYLSGVQSADLATIQEVAGRALSKEPSAATLNYHLGVLEQAGRVHGMPAAEGGRIYRLT